jgi:hypothetical protein|tara:strand:+ start:25761 stop:26183 length:423 start_codon:yes stop_codon:yes gene_type:complete
MSWFDIVRKYYDDELTEKDIKESIENILGEFSTRGYFQKKKVYKIDALVKEMKRLLKEIQNDEDVGVGYEFYFNTEEVLTKLTEENRLEDVIIELLKDTDNNEMGYMIGGDSFKLVDIYEEPYNELETYVFQTEEELRNA